MTLETHKSSSLRVVENVPTRLFDVPIICRCYMNEPIPPYLIMLMSLHLLWPQNQFVILISAEFTHILTVLIQDKYYNLGRYIKSMMIF